MDTIVRNIKDLEGWELREQITYISRNHKHLPLETYHEEMQVYVDEMNRRGRAIARKYNKRFKNWVVGDFTNRVYKGE